MVMDDANNSKNSTPIKTDVFRCIFISKYSFDQGVPRNRFDKKELLI